MSSGGGGSSSTGEYQYNWNPVVGWNWSGNPTADNPNGTNPDAILTRARELSRTPYTQYSGTRIEPINQDQVSAIDAIRNYAMNPGQNGPAAAASAQAQNTLQNQYLYGNQANPYGQQQNPWANAPTNVGQNPMLGNLQSGGMFDPFSGAGGGGNQGPMDGGGQTPGGSGGGGSQGPMGGAGGPGATTGQQPWQNLISPGSNPYSGTDSPYFQGQLQSALGDITNAYQQGTAANRTRMMNMAGVLGGGADQRQTGIDENILARNLSRTANEAYQQQYDRSAGLQENALNRGVGAQQFGLNLGNQAFENAAGRGLQTQGLGAGLYESGIGRDLQNAQFNKNLGGQWWQQQQGQAGQNFENERNRQVGAIGAGQNEQNLTMQRLQGLMGIGDFQRQYNQSFNDLGYQNWVQQQQHPWQMLNQYAGLVGQSSGGMNQTSFTPPMYGTPIGSQLLGAGLLASSFLR